VRQEFILLSDVLGVSMLVETINHRTGGTSTESTVLGPFHMVESPKRELGDDINLDRKGTPCLVSGRVTGPDGEPLPGASVDVWQTNEDGFYDVQQPDIQPMEDQLCGGTVATAPEPQSVGLPGHDVPLGRYTTVRRLLPQRQRRMVSAWCFVDHFGPEDVSGRPGMQVAPHPHTGLRTVTLLVDGEIVHRDSLGSDQPISPDSSTS
jgi:hypothetical protein